MENRASRKALRSFPPDLEFTQDPTDDLRKLLDIPGRHVQLASEFIASQMENLFLTTADPNEPHVAWVSGHTIPLNATVSGNIVEAIDEIASQQVTGFDHVTNLTLGGLPDGDIRGITFSRTPLPSGQITVSVSGIPNYFTYDWADLSQPLSSGFLGVTSQDFVTQNRDEYLVIERDTVYGIIATIQHSPLGAVTIIDTKNLQAPWDPSQSDGITADSSEITVSGDTLILQAPRPSYVPAVVSSSGVAYPPNYQPDENWNSAFVAEYLYNTNDPPYGLSQDSTIHNLGVEGTPLGGSDEI